MGSKRILVLGGDGYLGWPAALRFSARGNHVTIVENFAKRRQMEQLQVRPLLPLSRPEERAEKWKDATGLSIEIKLGDVGDPDFMKHVLLSTSPDAIIHCAGQASSSFSMLDRDRAVETQRDAVAGTLTLLFAMRNYCPGAHLVKIGSMAEFGAPNFDIEEGYLDVEHNGRFDRVPFPKRPPSFHHIAQAQDAMNIQFASETWKLRSTVLHTGVAYGVDPTESRGFPELATQFCYDDIFGSVVHRFFAEAVAGVPLTVYGNGENNVPIVAVDDVTSAIALAVDHPAAIGEYRPMNLFTEVYSLNGLAEAIARASGKCGIDATIKRISDPRSQRGNAYYKPKNAHLRALGLLPSMLSDTATHLIQKLQMHEKEINQGYFAPKVSWSIETSQQ